MDYKNYLETSLDKAPLTESIPFNHMTEVQLQKAAEDLAHRLIKNYVKSSDSALVLEMAKRLLKSPEARAEYRSLKGDDKHDTEIPKFISHSM